MAHYIVQKLSPDDKPKVRAFLHSAYYPDDPVLSAMNITQVHPTQDEHILGIIDEGYSYAAVTQDGTIVGILLMGEDNHDSSVNRRKEMENCPSPYFLKLLKFYETMEKDAKLLEVAQCDKGLEFHIAAVSPAFRRRGIMKQLFEYGMEIARQNGYKLVICTCASQYTANICQSLEWSCVYCLPYIYYEQDGERIFTNPQPPHLYSRIYVQYL